MKIDSNYRSAIEAEQVLSGRPVENIRVNCGREKENSQKAVYGLETQLKQFNLSPIVGADPKMAVTFVDLHPHLISDLEGLVIPKPIYPGTIMQASTGSTEMHQREQVQAAHFADLFDDFSTVKKCQLWR